MRVKLFTLLLVTSIVFLQGCGTSQEVSSGFHPSEHESTSTPTQLQDQEVTLHVESRLELGMRAYIFLGFIGEDTLAFQSRSFEYAMFQPAKVGHTFSFRNLGEGFKNQHVTAEVVDFNRDEGYVKLKITVEE